MSPTDPTDPTDPRFRRPAHLAADATGLVVTPQPPAQPRAASTASRAHQFQLTRITKLKQQIAELDTLAQAHRVAVHQRVHPLRTETRQQLRCMVLLIDQRLSGKTLARPQQRDAVTVLCDLAATLASEGDTEMAALHDRHSPTTLEEKARAQSQAMRADIEAALGAQLEDLPPEASMEHILAAGMARLREQEARADEDKRARAERRQAKKKSKPDPAQTQAQARLDNAAGLLRGLFRQLASALHPDREQDAAARERKTALMGQANAAYGRKDLLALLQLQHQAGLSDALGTGALAEEQLAAMTLLLKQQVADLERERAGRQDALAQEFELSRGASVTPRTLQMVLLEQIEELEMALEMMQADATMVQSDAGFKRWLKIQTAMMQRLG
jgi:hypothetical protein